MRKRVWLVSVMLALALPSVAWAQDSGMASPVVSALEEGAALQDEVEAIVGLHAAWSEVASGEQLTCSGSGADAPDGGCVADTSVETETDADAIVAGIQSASSTYACDVEGPHALVSGTEAAESVPDVLDTNLAQDDEATNDTPTMPDADTVSDDDGAAPAQQPAETLVQNAPEPAGTSVEDVTPATNGMGTVQAADDAQSTDTIVDSSESGDPSDQPSEPQPTAGLYAIRSASASTQLLDVQGAATTGNLITYQSNSGINQRFSLICDDEGSWHIVSALDGREVGNAAEANAQTCLTDEASPWRFEQRGSFWLIRSLASNLVLSVLGTAQNSAKAVLAEETEGLASQLWELIVAPSLQSQEDAPAAGYYRLRLPSGKVMDVRQAKAVAGTQLIAYTRSSDPNQIFHLEVTEQGFVRLCAGDTGLAVSSGADLVGGAGKAVLRKCSDYALNQLFRAVKVDGGWELRDVATGQQLGLASGEIVSGMQTVWTLQSAGNMLAQGLFELGLSTARSMRVDVRGASLEQAATVFQWERNGAQNQKWDLVRVGSNVYTVQNVRSGLYLAHDASGRAVQSATAEVFRAVPLVSGWGLLSQDTGLALRISGASTESRARAEFAAQDGSAAERFKLYSTVPLADGTYAIELTAARSLVVATKGESFEKKTNVQLATWAGDKISAKGSQKWMFVRNDDGTYTIINAYSELALDAAGSKPSSGSNVTQWTSKDSTNQRWRLVYNHDGSFDIVNVANKDVMLTAGGQAAGKNVNVSADKNRPTQRFAFKPTSFRYPAISGDSELDGYLRTMVKKYGTGRDGLYRAYVAIGALPYIYMNEYPGGSWQSWSIPYAKFMYKTGAGNCYRYASLMCWFARAIGYDARTISGQIVLGGAWAAHGWVEVTSNGGKQVIDCRLGNYRNRVYGDSLARCFLVSYASYPYQARVVTYA